MSSIGLREDLAVSARRSGRIAIRMSLEVSGVDHLGKEFHEKAFTTVVSRHGAAISIARRLDAQQQIRIRRLSLEIESAFRVVGQIGDHDEERVYGVARENAGRDVWGITFPEVGDAAELLANLLLECRNCNSREVVYMADIELEVFAAKHHVVRNCTGCRRRTEWFVLPDDLTSERQPHPLLDKGRPNPKAVTFEGRNGLAPGLSVAIRHHGDTEVLATSDLSKGGLGFLSEREYPISSCVEIAAPYVEGGANIYTTARVTRVEEVGAQGLRRYGVRYVAAR